MSDLGTRSADYGALAIAKRIRKIYGKASKEIKEIITAYNLRFMAQDAKKRAQLATGEISKDEYADWLKRAVFRGKLWDSKADHCADIMTNANKVAMGVIRNEQIGVFTQNRNFQAYKLETDLGMDMGFNLYSSETVNLLLKKQPELLPRRIVNGVKDRAWNKNKIAGEITKSIIKGDGIKQVADSLADVLQSQNETAMKRYARTAMTSAQNAGRMEMLDEAEKMGIKAKKKWIATLDEKTRQTHRDLDGQVVDKDKPFHVNMKKGKNGDIMFPGDPNADPSLVYNCRCVLGYVLNGVTKMGSRRAYYYDKNGYRKSYIVKDMTYREWEAWKNGRDPS